MTTVSENRASNLELPEVDWLDRKLNPDKFFDTLYQNDYNVISKQSFPDHHQYTE